MVHMAQVEGDCKVAAAATATTREEENRPAKI
jgi:hypothetical protein